MLLCALLKGRHKIFMQHIHILGICGTFMGSLAQLAVAKGYKVTGCDANVYPPMSDQLQQAGIELIEGYAPEQLALNPDLFVVGNAMSRGNPLVEAILDQGLAYTSGPQWLHDFVLKDKWVLAVSGTHGKTTTSSMLAWILEYAGMSPGYLIGGVPSNFSVSARLGDTPFFVIEADEYDSAFFDKRSKFVHYRPRTLVINNLEFDHADIFNSLADIQRQFHHLVRTVPGSGLIIVPETVQAIDDVIEQGCWTPTQTFSLSNTGDWQARLTNDDGSSFEVIHDRQAPVNIEWTQLGNHSVSNALAAIAAAHHVGVTVEVAAEALSRFLGVKRRLECLLKTDKVCVYDDFAHHPTAIKTTLEGLRAKVGDEQIIALIEPRSNTMRMGIHQASLAAACDDADHVLWYSPPELSWDIESVIRHSNKPAQLCSTIEQVIERALLLLDSTPSMPAHIVIMSNGSFADIHRLLVKRLQ
jgi:UDP-N-acetylmuramate: L-alanyl-gamma-D-glutamyl-meso-diaminopimelate ligase